jgi:hypothetical protein
MEPLVLTIAGINDTSIQCHRICSNSKVCVAETVERRHSSNGMRQYVSPALSISPALYHTPLDIRIHEAQGKVINHLIDV